MTIYNVINLLGGVALFLYGMTIMGSGLEKVAGGKMQSVLQKLISTTLRGVLLGTLITGVIQSSAGTIVIVIGLVNSGIMTLPQAVGVIMGANIGTTVTGQLIRLADIQGAGLLNLLKPSTFSPIVAFIGAILFVFNKNAGKKNVGQIMMGFGILFTGMSMMDGAVAPLKESAFFINMFANLQNPLLGLLVGAGATILIQSSSASVGLLQALTSTGLITWGSAFPVIMGTHIGTAFTPLVASAGANKNAKRSAVIHLYFNVISAILFVIVVCLLNLLIPLPFWTSILNKGDVANIHTFSSVIATIVLFPFAGLLVKLSVLTVPDKEGDNQDMTMPVLDDRLMGTPAVAIQQAKSAVYKMFGRAEHNYHLSVPLLFEYDDSTVERINAREDLIDRMEVSVSHYLVRISEHSLTEREGHQVNELLSYITDIERIGDYSINVQELAEELRDKDLHFSQQAENEIAILHDAVAQIIQLTMNAFNNNDLTQANHVEPLEEVIDLMCDTLRKRHIQRLKEGICQIDPGIIFLDVLTNLERISDHCSNIAARLVGVEDGYDEMNSHLLKQRLHEGGVPDFNDMMAEYKKEYFFNLQEDED